MANDHLLRFEVGSDSAVGTIVDSVGFMRLRAQRWKFTDEPDDFPRIAARSDTDLHLTVTAERQWVWLDDPANTITTLT